MRKSNAWNTTTDRSKLHEISQDLRQIESLAASLHGDLEKGEGLEATTPVYEQILQRREYAKSDAMFVDINEFLKPKLAATRAALLKLSAYYAKQPSPCPSGSRAPRSRSQRGSICPERYRWSPP